MFAGGVEYTLLFKCPHEKESHGVKSGNLGGLSIAWFSAIILLLNTCHKKFMLKML